MLCRVGRASLAPLLSAALEEQFMAGSIPVLTYFFYCLQSELSLILIPGNIHKEKIVPGRKQETVLYEFIKMNWSST